MTETITAAQLNAELNSGNRETITLKNGRTFNVVNGQATRSPKSELPRPSPPASRAHRVIATPLDGEPVMRGTLRLSIRPISANHIFANAKKGRVKAPRYDIWRTQVTLELRQQPSWHVPGKISVVIAITDEARLDVDNAIKGILDSLVYVGRIEDDRNVVDVRAYFDSVVTGTLIEIQQVAA